MIDDFRDMMPDSKEQYDQHNDELIFEGWHRDEKEIFTGWRNDSFGNDCRDHDQDAWNYPIDESDSYKKGKH